MLRWPSGASASLTRFFPSSTGIIGVPFPEEEGDCGPAPELRDGLGSTAAHAEMFAQAIMTTDTRMKVARAVVDVDGVEVRIFGAAKGAGDDSSAARGSGGARRMPRCWCTCLRICRRRRGELRTLPGLRRWIGVLTVFRSMAILRRTIPCCCWLVGQVESSWDERVGEAFRNALALVCGSLAHQIVDDGEGVGHLVTLHVTGGGRPRTRARQVAKGDCAFSAVQDGVEQRGPELGGGLLAAAGYSGVAIEAEKVRISIGAEPVFEGGMRAPEFDEAAAHAVMLQAAVYDHDRPWGWGLRSAGL